MGLKSYFKNAWDVKHVARDTVDETASRVSEERRHIPGAVAEDSGLYRGYAYPEDPGDEMSCFVRDGDVKRVRALFKENFWRGNASKPGWDDLRHCLLKRDYEMARLLVTYGVKPRPEEMAIHLHLFGGHEASLKEELAFMSRCGLHVTPRQRRGFAEMIDLMPQKDRQTAQKAAAALNALLPETHPVRETLDERLSTLNFVDPARLISDGEFQDALDMLETDILTAGKVDMTSVVDIWIKSRGLSNRDEIERGIHNLLATMVRLGVEVAGIDPRDEKLQRAPRIACDLQEMGFCSPRDFDLKTVIKNWHDAGDDAPEYADYKVLATRIADATGACVPDLDGRGVISGHRLLGKLADKGRAQFALDLLDTGAVAVTHHDLSDVNRVLTHSDDADHDVVQELHDRIFDMVKHRTKYPDRAAPPARREDARDYLEIRKMQQRHLETVAREKERLYMKSKSRIDYDRWKSDILTEKNSKKIDYSDWKLDNDYKKHRAFKKKYKGGPYGDM